MKIKKLFDNLTTKIILASVAINLILLFIIYKNFDFITTITYAVFALIVARVAYSSNKKMKPIQYFAAGLAIPVLYNWGLMLLGVFGVTTWFIVMAALQQGIITFITSKVFGVRK